jgi:hypothetical protein
MMTIAAIAVAMKGEATVAHLKAEDGDARCY